MSRIVLTDELRHDYQRAFANCEIRQEQTNAVERLVETLWADRDRYHQVGERLNMPWFVVAVLHEVDAGRDFTVHLHNGDPLTDRTHHLPEGRPLEGEPPFTWEDSAIDALRLVHLDLWRDWSIAGTLFVLEERGGWGYRLHHSEVPSPYLWNCSRYYTQGKYVANETWSETGVAQRCGAAVLLRRLAERGWIDFSSSEPSVEWPLLRYDPESISPWVESLQRCLNTLPGFYLKVDGRAGSRTSDAFHKLTGVYLPGDLRVAEKR